MFAETWLGETNRKPRERCARAFALACDAAQPWGNCRLDREERGQAGRHTFPAHAGLAVRNA